MLLDKGDQLLRLTSSWIRIGSQEAHFSESQRYSVLTCSPQWFGVSLSWHFWPTESKWFVSVVSLSARPGRCGLPWWWSFIRVNIDNYWSLIDAKPASRPVSVCLLRNEHTSDTISNSLSVCFLCQMCSWHVKKIEQIQKNDRYRLWTSWELRASRAAKQQTAVGVTILDIF